MCRVSSVHIALTPSCTSTPHPLWILLMRPLMVPTNMCVCVCAGANMRLKRVVDQLMNPNKQYLHIGMPRGHRQAHPHAAVAAQTSNSGQCAGGRHCGLFDSLKALLLLNLVFAPVLLPFG